MIVDNGAAIPRHSLTGRELNLGDDEQTGLDVLTKAGRMLRAGEIAINVRDLFKLTHKKTRQGTLDRIAKLLYYLALNPETRIAVKGIPAAEVNIYRRILPRLEEMEYIEIYQGFASEKGSRPMAITAGPKLIKLLK